MTLESTRISPNCSTIAQISTVATVPASYRLPTQRSMKPGSQTMTVAPAAAASSQQSTSVSARTRAARSRSPAPTMPPNPGMVAEITMNTASLTACGTSEVRLYVATTAVPARAPSTM